MEGQVALPWYKQSVTTVTYGVPSAGIHSSISSIRPFVCLARLARPDAIHPYIHIHPTSGALPTGIRTY